MSEPSLELSIGDTFELTATVFPEDTDTKTTLVADGTVEWCPKDEISVFYGNGSNGGSRFTSQNTELAPVVDFKGCLEDVSIGGENFTEGKFLYGIYPYSKNSSLKDGIATISLPFRQNSAEETFVNGLLPTIARSQNFKLAFYNICGGVVFTLSRNDITSIRFRGNNGERIAGRAKVAFDELGRPVVLDEEVESKGEITLYPPEGGTFKANEKYYIAAYPASLQSVLPLHYGLQECKKEYVWEISPLKSGVLL